jgi:iron complex outermembrane receptor protein
MKRLLTLLIATSACTMMSAEVADSLSLNEVVVTGTRSATDIRHLPMTVTVIGRDQLTAEHQASILPTVMREVPGLFITSRGMMGYGVSGGGSGAINVRGISSGTAESGAGQMMVLIDGHPHYQGLFGHTIADSYQALMAERIEVLRGPASVLYGSNAMGGVINIVTRQAKKDGVNTNVTLGAGSYGTIQTEASNQIRLGRFSSTIAAQYNRTDNHRPDMGFEQFGGMAKLGYDLNANWNASADIELTRFIASYPGSTTSPLVDADQWITRGIASVGVTNNYGKTNGGLSLYYTFGNHKINDGHAPTASAKTNYFRSEDALMGITWYQNAHLFKGNRLTIGLDYQHIYGKAWNQVMATGEDLAAMVNKRENEIAGYIDVCQDLTDWLTIDAGLRLDNHSQAGTEWIPQGGLVVRPMDNGELKATISKGFRNPTIREMYLFGTKNAELKAERLMNYELGWRHRMNDGYTYGINAFYIKGSNIIQQMPVSGGKRFMNTGEIENWGVEAEASCPINPNLNIHANSSYLHMKNKVIAAPEATFYVGIDFHKDKWAATLGLQHIEDLYTEVGAKETKEDFRLLNASISYAALKNVSLWARGENLLAQKYEINAGYPMPRATFMGGVSVNF